MTDPQVLRHGAWQEITPEVAGWQFVTFEVRTLAEGETYTWEADGNERALVNLHGDFQAVVNGETIDFGGRDSVFDGLGHTLYVPRSTAGTVTGTPGAELAIASAPASQQHEVRLVTPAELPVESRGAGNASRQVATPIPPDFPADRLLVIEVWTPGGNWSSYPPHKHEQDTDGEAQLEETYYYRLRDPKRGWALQKVYSPDRGFELDATVRDGDICLLPWGYHTTVAAHGHDLYYLNVMAGPAPQRTLQAADDPDLGALRAAWADMDVDARVPFIPQYPAS